MRVQGGGTKTRPSAPRVRFRLAAGDDVELGTGGVIGRMAHAALCVDDPRVSEAHAMVSLRGGQLHLLALRGQLSVRGHSVAQVRLTPGLCVELVSGIALEVVSLVLPTALIALTGLDGGQVPLVHSVYSLYAGPPPRLVPRFDAEAHGWIWAVGDHYRFRCRGGEAMLIAPGVPIRCGVAALEPCLQSLEAADCPPTNRPSRGLTIRARYETVHLHTEDDVALVVSGIGARMISELVQFGVPVPWWLVADAIWPGTNDPFAQRRNWDRNMARLRKKLGGAGVREDLVRPDGCGSVELYLLPGDVVLDET